MTNKRLAWNFEINTETAPLDMSKLRASDHSEWKFEMRHFWKEDRIICLYGLDEAFLNLSNYKIKERNDRYFLIPGQQKNIKERRGELVYKPLMQQSKGLLAFAKKIHLNQCPPEEILPGSPEIAVAPMLDLIHSEARPITVTKVALVYSFPLEPVIKLELARLSLEGKVYFSASVEGRSPALVHSIGHHLLQKNGEALGHDYVSFLTTTMGLP